MVVEMHTWSPDWKRVIVIIVIVVPVRQMMSVSLGEVEKMTVAVLWTSSLV
jgi:hypothetical protein